MNKKIDKKTISSQQYFKNTGFKIDEYKMSNICNVVDIDKNSYFNITKTIKFVNMEQISPNAYMTYQILETDTWTNLSFKFYNTYKLWWLICKFNNIKNPFTDLTVGTVIKIPTPKLVQNILLMIRT